jgi:hypothetical protein
MMMLYMHDLDARGEEGIRRAKVVGDEYTRVEGRPIIIGKYTSYMLDGGFAVCGVGHRYVCVCVPSIVHGKSV